MGELRLHAISVYDLRDMFGADDDLAAQLRRIASETFAVPATEEQLRPSMIRKIGPMFRRDPLARVVPTDVPIPSDWETLIAGRYVEPSRLVASWKVVDAWVDARDWGTATMTLSPPQTEAFDFALTKAGLHSSYSLGNLFANDIALPIRPAHGMRVGYAKNQHVLATGEALRAVLDRVDPDWVGARYLSSFLDAFAGWTEQARAADRVLPDLYCARWETSRAEMSSTTAPDEPSTGTRRRDPEAAFDPSAPIVTGRQARTTAPKDLDPTAPIVTGRQPRRQ